MSDLMPRLQQRHQRSSRGSGTPDPSVDRAPAIVVCATHDFSVCVDCASGSGITQSKHSLRIVLMTRVRRWNLRWDNAAGSATLADPIAVSIHPIRLRRWRRDHAAGTRTSSSDSCAGLVSYRRCGWRKSQSSSICRIASAPRKCTNRASA